MSRSIYILAFLFFLTTIFAQSRLQQAFPKSAITAQFAGSTGLVTAGFSKVSARDKIEVGLLYGYTPRRYGDLNALVLKGTYNPFHITITEKIKLEPIQTGLFISQNFGKNLGLKWGEEYPYGYYWWSRSTRFHFFISTQASYKLDTKYMDRLSLYFEANTNDLYVFSYVPNRNALSLYDIFFFGTGIKLYLK